MSDRVLIVGGGPVGLTLSLALARFGVASTILEKRLEPTSTDESRAITWMPRGLDLLEWLGIEDEFMRSAMLRERHDFSVGGVRRLTLRFDRLDARHPYALDLPQGESERIIERAALASGFVEIRRGHEVVRAGSADGTAAAKIRTEEGKSYKIEAPWGVACDGYHSSVREFLTIGTSRRDYGASSAVADFEGAGRILDEGTSCIALEPERPHGFFRFGPERWRMIYRINEGELREQMVGDGEVRRLIGELAPGFELNRILWASAFRLGQQQSDAYHDGKWVLAGDAAHGMGPSAGAGMQVGVLGAWRLAWRLSIALSRPETATILIADYCREQRAASDQVQFGNGLIFRNLALRSRPVAAVRSALLGIVGSLPPVVARMTAATALTDQSVPVRQSSLLSDLAPSFRRIRGWRGWREGMRMPTVGVPTALTRWPADTPAAHAVVVLTKQAEPLAATVAAELGTRLTFASDPIGMDSHEAVLAIVRPDQEVAALLASS